jgi:small subunit ribosomal protein S21
MKIIKVTARGNENIDALLKRFNNLVAQDGILKELKERAHYEKPSVKKRRKAIEMRNERNNPVK